MSLLYYKQCIICGKFYQPNKHNQVTCGDRKCQNKRTRQTELRKKLEKKNRDLNKMALLTKEAIMANNLNMTYGQFKAAQWCRNKQHLKMAN